MHDYQQPQLQSLQVVHLLFQLLQLLFQHTQEDLVQQLRLLRLENERIDIEILQKGFSTTTEVLVEVLHMEQLQQLDLYKQVVEMVEFEAEVAECEELWHDRPHELYLMVEHDMY